MNLTMGGIPSAPIIQLLAGSIAVIALLVVFLFVLQRVTRTARTRSDRRIQILETQVLGPKQKMLLVRLDDQELLIGVTPSGLSTLAGPREHALASSSELQTWSLRREQPWTTPS
jgi:flagellar protein FliO/FliZ